MLIGALACSLQGAEPPLVFTQVPGAAQRGESPAQRGRIVRREPSGALRVLTPAFHSAADPEISWDGRRILFAGRRTAGSHWQIFEMRADGTGLRQVVRVPWDCRQPIYQSKIFYLDDAQPEPQIAFTGTGAGTWDATRQSPATHLYSARLNGSGLRRLTYNLLSDRDPYLNEDGRILYSSAQPHRKDAPSSIYGVNLDGTDQAIYTGPAGRRLKRAPVLTADRRLLFVENDREEWDGSGSLALVDARDNLNTYQPWSGLPVGLYATPAALSAGALLVSRRPASGAGTHGIYRLEAATGKMALVYDSPAYHDFQARAIAPRPTPPGRASVVDESVDWTRFYCLSVHVSDGPPSQAVPARIRVVAAEAPKGRGQAAVEELLGEAALEADGSFQFQLPANRLVRFETIDSAGRPLRSSAWIWGKNKAQRGCIGCHEDGNLTPENRFPDALHKPAAVLPAAQAAHWPQGAGK